MVQFSFTCFLLFSFKSSGVFLCYVVCIFYHYYVSLILPPSFVKSIKCSQKLQRENDKSQLLTVYVSLNNNQIVLTFLISILCQFQFFLVYIVVSHPAGPWSRDFPNQARGAPDSPTAWSSLLPLQALVRGRAEQHLCHTGASKA